jgi:uncharacterized protein YndB with AHSA1/START domain
MPTKFDASGKRWVEMEFLVPGTPDQVWQAMATGPGNAAWFTRAEIEEKIGGQLTFHFMPGATSGGTVTGWEPPHRFGYVEVGWAENAPPIATEISIVARSGDECLVRMVHSLFSATDDWDDQMEGFESGWPGFIEVLRLYLSHHAGSNAASFQLTAEAKGEALVVWRKLLEGLGHETADAGENWTVDAGETLFGEVVGVRQDGEQRYVLLRIDGDVPGVGLFGIYGMGGAIRLSVCRFFYGPKAGEAAAASEPKWQAWLDGIAKA